MRKDWLPVSLHKFGVLALVLVTFTLSDWLSHESGLLAVTVFGIWLANQEGLDLEEVLASRRIWRSSSSLPSSSCWRPPRSGAALATRSHGAGAAVRGAVRGPSALHPGLDPGIGSPLARPGPARLDSPRGIVAAAVSASFAISMHEAGIEDADKLVPLVFAVIIFTVVLQSLTATPLARLLGMRQPAPDTWLLIGANSVAAP